MQAPANIMSALKHVKHAYQYVKILFYIPIEKFMMHKMQQLDRLKIYSKHTEDAVFDRCTTVCQ